MPNNDTAAQVARLRDPRRDPQAGDLVIYGPQWQRERLRVVGMSPKGKAVLYAMDHSHVLAVLLEEWREWMVDAEVLHVADQ